MANNGMSASQMVALQGSMAVLAKDLSRIANNVDGIRIKVGDIEAEVQTIDLKVEQLVSEFRAFADEANRIANLADAKQTVVMLEQEMEKKFGHYDAVRRHTVGILQAADIGIIRKETITTATEELMLETPRYWLAPALVALSAWIADNKPLADKALQEAMRRDDEKTSLLFCLISRRSGKYNGCLRWLERYFSMQDPTKMESRIVVVLDAFASGLFGHDAEGRCSEKIKNWLEELAGRVGFAETQREQWGKALYARRANTDAGDFEYLREHSETWPKMKEVLDWATSHQKIYEYFSAIFNAPIGNINSLAMKVDEIIDNLVTNYDNEELPLRKAIRRNHIVIEENGVLDRAMDRLASEEKTYEQHADFSQHLTDVALNPEKTGALIATQKLAIAMSKEWIIDAYSDLTANSRANIPVHISFNIVDWSASTQIGDNELALEQELNTYIDTKQNESLSKVKFVSFQVIMVILVCGVVAFGFGGISSVFAIAGLGAYLYKRKINLQKIRDQIVEEAEKLREYSQTVLKAILAEVVDYRRLYAAKDADYNQTASFLNDLSAQQYVANVETKTRKIL